MKYKILVLCHKYLVPPENVDEKSENFEYSSWITEYDVIKTLKKCKHDVLVLGVYSDLLPIRNAIETFKPNVVFNLLEEFDGEVLYDQNVVSYLELLKAKYTGASPRGLMISRDKSLTKKLLSYHRVLTPKFQVFGKSKTKKLNKKLKYPIIVKCLYEEASLGLANASVVKNEEKLYERVGYLIDKYNTDVIVEEFVEGREFYVGIIGNKRLTVLPVWELKFEKAPNPEKELYSENAKWNKNYRERKGIKSEYADIDKNLREKIIKVCKKAYKTLELSGYARVDLRVNSAGDVYVLEVNPNPNIAKADEFALSAKKHGISYKDLLTKIIKISI